MFLVAYGVDPDAVSGEQLLLEVHLIISGDFVITIHRRPIAALHDLRERVPKHPKRSEQFLVYKILDAVTSTFFPVLTRIDDDIDEIEQDVIERADRGDPPADLLAEARLGRDAARDLPGAGCVRAGRRADRRLARPRGRRPPLFPRSVRRPRPNLGAGRLLPGPAERHHRHVPLDGRQPPGRGQQAADDDRDDVPAADVPDRLLRSELLVPDRTTSSTRSGRSSCSGSGCCSSRSSCSSSISGESAGCRRPRHRRCCRPRAQRRRQPRPGRTPVPVTPWRGRVLRPGAGGASRARSPAAESGRCPRRAGGSWRRASTSRPCIP